MVEKHCQRDDVSARVLYPRDVPPAMAFGHEMDGALVDRVLTEAERALDDELRHGVRQ